MPWELPPGRGGGAGALGCGVGAGRFTLAPALHGQGYATEAVRAALGHLFRRGLHRVSAECDARNTPRAACWNASASASKAGAPSTP
ncbi:GNAT family N-acetyltransferase [Streptomyces chrestomyceticus]|uniref:GNAT family N-acetyltransferase n=1 Tax=Streptomyces chrestomyceticus TaxID=68185 RepID=UPI0033C6487F